MESAHFDPDWKEKNFKKDPLSKQANEAKELGMSYGQYQAYLASKSVPFKKETITEEDIPQQSEGGIKDEI